MELFVADHPLISHKVTLLRDKNTSSSQFRQLVEELVTLLTFEATKNLATVEVEVETPLTWTKGVRLASPAPLIIPILRAGLGMLSGITKLLPDAEVGFLGIKRNEETLQPETYTLHPTTPPPMTTTRVLVFIWLASNSLKQSFPILLRPTTGLRTLCGVR